jgi:RNA polymerase sigma-70 factor, ECF subfamily
VTERVLTHNALLMTATNEDALEAAIREHSRLVYRIAYSVSRNHQDAEDATQETFMRVLRYRRKLEGIDDPKTWIARIAWRVAVEQAKKQPAACLGGRQAANATTELLRANGKTAEELASTREMATIVESLIAALPESLRDAIRLSTVDELLPGEIAQMLETSEASVRSRLFRARQILKDKLRALEVQHGTTR